MNDLISRQELLKLFVNLRDEHETTSISYNALYELILKQPTAFDVEKVVAELKEKKDDARVMAGLRSIPVGEDEYEEDELFVGMKLAYGNAIEMVKKGGVEHGKID